MAVITVSRQMGSGGDHMARQLAEDLGYNLVDSGLIYRVAERAGVSVDEVKEFDEKYHSRAVEWLMNFITPRIGKIITHEEEKLDPESYIEYSKTVVRGLAEEGNMVIVGRGGQFILHEWENALNIRIMASEDFRAINISERKKISYDNALETVRKSERQRQSYTERYFHRDINDTRWYDLVVDVSCLGTKGAYHVIQESAKIFSMIHEFIPGKKDRRLGERRKHERRRAERRNPTSIWTVKDMERAILRDGRSVRSYSKIDRRKSDRRKGDRRKTSSLSQLEHA